MSAGPAGAPGPIGGAAFRRAYFAGWREILGAPGLVLAANFLGFGALARSSGLTLDLSLWSSATTWALPGQLVMAELFATGASVLTIALAVALTNARLLPMVAALLPYLDQDSQPRWRLYLLAHFLAVTSWVTAMRRYPDMAVAQRLPFTFGVGTGLWSITFLATGVGFALAGSVPSYLSTGLVFMNPIYFMLVLGSDLRDRARAFAFVLGGLSGPPLHALNPEWGLLVAGLAAGTAAFLAHRLLPPGRSGTSS